MQIILPIPILLSIDCFLYTLFLGLSNNLRTPNTHQPAVSGIGRGIILIRSAEESSPSLVMKAEGSSNNPDGKPSNKK